MENVAEACPDCGAVPDEHGNIHHLNPTEEQRARAVKLGLLPGEVQRADLALCPLHGFPRATCPACLEALMAIAAGAP